MKTLPNGVTVFNVAPYTIRFWSPDWAEPVEVEPDEVIAAEVVEIPVGEKNFDRADITLATLAYAGSEAGQRVVYRALGTGADIVVGSITAAQAYKPLVLATVPAEGYEHAPPAEACVRPDRFIVFQ